MTSTNLVPIQNALNPVYPRQPNYDSDCGINQIYQTMPPFEENPTYWETTAFGPASVKHIYEGVANYYPYQRITRPVNTLYGHDYSQYHSSGVGRGKRISYQYKLYPFTNRNVRETRDYADVILPYMDFREWTKYPIRRDSSVNSPLHTLPNAYLPNLQR